MTARWFLVLPVALAAAAAGRAADPPAPRTARMAVGTVGGTVVKADADHLTLKLTGVVAVPGRHHGATVQGQRVSVPQARPRTVHQDVTYDLVPDVVVTVGGKKTTPPAAPADVHPGDAVVLHLARQTVRTPGERPVTTTVVTRIDAPAHPTPNQTAPK